MCAAPQSWTCAVSQPLQRPPMQPLSCQHSSQQYGSLNAAEPIPYGSLAAGPRLANPPVTGYVHTPTCCCCSGHIGQQPHTPPNVHHPQPVFPTGRINNYTDAAGISVYTTPPRNYRGRHGTRQQLQQKQPQQQVLSGLPSFRRTFHGSTDSIFVSTPQNLQPLQYHHDKSFSSSLPSVHNIAASHAFAYPRPPPTPVNCPQPERQHGPPPPPPTVPLGMPLHIDTKIEYTLDTSKFPGISNDAHATHPALIIDDVALDRQVRSILSEAEAQYRTACEQQQTETSRCTKSECDDLMVSFLEISS